MTRSTYPAVVPNVAPIGLMVSLHLTSKSLESNGCDPRKERMSLPLSFEYANTLPSVLSKGYEQIPVPPESFGKSHLLVLYQVHCVQL